jgi:hypothetical protein
MAIANSIHHQPLVLVLLHPEQRLIALIKPLTAVLKGQLRLATIEVHGVFGVLKRRSVL